MRNQARLHLLPKRRLYRTAIEYIRQDLVELELR